jgi:hypothetical protein
MRAGTRDRSRLPSWAIPGVDATPGMNAQARANTYGSVRVARASQCAQALRFKLPRLGPMRLAQALLRLPSLALLLLTIPRLDVETSATESGRQVRIHLGQRSFGLPRFQLAQGVLGLPDSFALYMRGRHRQAVRTNVRRALEQGIVCHHFALTSTAAATLPAAHVLTLSTYKDECPVADQWADAPAIDVPGVPGEFWWACDASGAVVARGWLTVDDGCAILHGLVTTGTGVRWLVHTAMVERLCAAGCRLLLTNSFDVPLMDPGLQYFQGLLGYSIARIRLRGSKDGTPYAEARPARETEAEARRSAGTPGRTWSTHSGDV